MKLFKIHGLSKRYALRADMYRRVARRNGYGPESFSEDHLRELHAKESRGIGEIDKQTNGFAYGKWLVDLSVKSWIEDISQGNAAKIEFLGTPLERLHNRSKLENVMAGCMRWAYEPHARALSTH
jgi:hypothetical protein